jgi:thioredoxin reductase (NADPH)
MANLPVSPGGPVSRSGITFSRTGFKRYNTISQRKNTDKSACRVPFNFSGDRPFLLAPGPGICYPERKVFSGSLEEEKALAEAETHDIIIVGGGPAGYTAAQYAARADRKVLVLERMLSGGQIASSEMLENYPGFPEGIGGFEFGQLLEKQARRFGAEIAMEEVVQVEREGGLFKVKTKRNTYTAGAVITATGASPRSLGIPGEAEFRGRGVSYCATCDGAFFRERDLVVVGGGDAALEEAVYLTRFARKVMLVHRRDRFRAVKYLQERAFKNAKISLYLSHVILEIGGGQKVEKVVLEDLARGEVKTVKADGIFFYVGNDPNTSFLGDLPLKKSPGGFLETGEDMGTDIPGLFAAGDVRVKALRQVATAVSDGAVAAVSAVKYLEELELG